MLTDFQNSFSGRFISKFATKSSLSILPHIKHVAMFHLVKHEYRKTSENMKHA